MGGILDSDSDNNVIQQATTPAQTSKACNQVTRGTQTQESGLQFWDQIYATFSNEQPESQKLVNLVIERAKVGAVSKAEAPSSEKLKYKYEMMKQKYALLTEQYNLLTQGRPKEEICEQHVKQIYKLQGQVYKLQKYNESQQQLFQGSFNQKGSNHEFVSDSESKATLDKESSQIKLLKSQYEREKRLVEDKIRELTIVSHSQSSQRLSETSQLEMQVDSLKDQLHSEK